MNAPEKLGTGQQLGADEADIAANAWEECARVVKDHSDEMFKRWREEIDTLLVYAGLFSAAITAFNAQSYALLQPSQEDTTVALLAQISAQLNGLSVNASFINSTTPADFPTTSSSFRPPGWSIWVNALWFSSLICSLSAASIGIMVKQWLHEAARGVSGTSRNAARMRQFRYDGLRRWHVGTVVATLPVLLQLAAMFFFAGLLVLLWNLNSVVAIAASVLVGTLLLFNVATTVIPTFAVDCSYRSPQSLGFFLAVQALGRMSRPALRILARIDGSAMGTTRWLISLHDHIMGVVHGDWGAFRGWVGRERVELPFTQNALDEHILQIADEVVLDNKFLEQAIRPCVQVLPSWSGLSCCKQIRAGRMYHLGPLWGQYGSLGHTSDAMVDITLDAINRCLDDPMGLYDAEDLENALTAVVDGLKNPVAPATSEAFGVLVSRLLRSYSGALAEIAFEGLCDRIRDTYTPCLYLGATVRDVINSMEDYVQSTGTQWGVGGHRPPTRLCIFMDSLAILAIHHTDTAGTVAFIVDRLKHHLHTHIASPGPPSEALRLDEVPVDVISSLLSHLSNLADAMPDIVLQPVIDTIRSKYRR